MVSGGGGDCLWPDEDLGIRRVPVASHVRTVGKA